MDRIERRQGLALVLVIGVMTLLALAAAVFTGLSSRLRLRTDIEADHVAAGLLARSGVEYAGARLAADLVPKASPTRDNQSDDWTCRDDSSVPLENARNPSYAQTEPYVEQGIPNGRFDAGTEPFADLNGNNRFDSWSGRLRGRRGAVGTTFALRISGRNGEAGINVNGGFLGDPDHPDVNKNQVDDWRDVGERDGASEGPLTQYDAVSRNQKLAFSINQLGLLLGLASPRPGDAVVKGRPKGGYQDLEELAAKFPAPGDWARLKPHLSVVGRRNRSAASLYRILAKSVASVKGGGTHVGGGLLGNGVSVNPAFTILYKGWYSPDVRYGINLESASVETVAAVFSGIGSSEYHPDYVSWAVAWQPLTPQEALQAARFIKQAPFAGWRDLYDRLQRQAPSLFLPDTPATGEPSNKAAWVSALAMPEEVGKYADGDPRQLKYGSLPGGGAFSRGSGLWPLYDGWGSYDSPAGRRIKGLSLNLEGGSHGSLDLSAGPLAAFSVESLGRVIDGNGQVRVRRSAFGFLAEGRIQAGNQADFENVAWDPVLKKAADPNRFEGGFILGRPVRDRATTYPCFSRDACPRNPSAAFDAFLDFDGHALTPTGTAIQPWGGQDGPIYDYGYSRYYGEVMLMDRSWVDPKAVFYQPNWDSRQPEWTGPGPSAPWHRCFGDVAGGASIRMTTSDLQGTLGSFLDAGVRIEGMHAEQATSSYEPFLGPIPQGIHFHFDWGTGSGNAGDFPLVDASGTAPRGTIEGWFSSLGRFVADNPMFVTAGSVYWNQANGPSGGGGGGGTSSNADLAAAILDSIPGLAASTLQGQPPPPPDTTHSGGGGGGGGSGGSSSGAVGPFVFLSFVVDTDRVSAYMNGIYQWGTGYDVNAVDGTKFQSLDIFGIDELRMYRSPLSQEVVQAHAQRGGYWTADPAPFPDTVSGHDLKRVPSFTSSLYIFDSPARLTGARWDGFVPKALLEAAADWNQTHPGAPVTPLKVELVVSRAVANGVPDEVIPLAADGRWTDFDKAIGGKVRSLRYRVWFDVSTMDPAAWETPTFDGIEIGFSGGLARMRCD